MKDWLPERLAVSKMRKLSMATASQSQRTSLLRSTREARGSSGDQRVGRIKFTSLGTSLVAGTVALVLAACASTSVRSTQLQSDPALVSGAALVTQDADAAVRVAERDSDPEAYRVLRIDVVRAQAETRLAEDQRPGLRAVSKETRLDARTRELDLAQNQTALDKLEDAEQALAAITAHGEADAANRAAATSDQQASDARREAEGVELATSISRQQTAELQPQIDLLQARITGSGVMVTFAGFAVFR